MSSDEDSDMGSPSPPQSARKSRYNTQAMSSPMLRHRTNMPLSPRLNKRAASAILRAPKPGTILRSQLSHLDDIRFRVLTKFPRPTDLPLPLSSNSSNVSLNGNINLSNNPTVPGTPPSNSNNNSNQNLPNNYGESNPQHSQNAASPSSMASPLNSPTARYSPSSPQLDRHNRINSNSNSNDGNSSLSNRENVISRSNSLASGLTKLKRGSTKLRMMGTVSESPKSPSSSSSNTSSTTNNTTHTTNTTTGQPETKDENSQKNDGRRFARIMQKRASRLKMLTELEREKRKGETIKAAWKEDRRRQQEDTEQQTKGKSLLNRIKTPLERLRGVVKNNKTALQLSKKVDMMDEASKAEEERHRAELEGFKSDLNIELSSLRTERDQLAQKLLKAENAPAEVKRQMTEELRKIKMKLIEKQKELERQRDEVHRELSQMHAAEKQKIVTKHTEELEAMHQALDIKEKELIAQKNLTQDELASKVNELQKQKKEVEQYLEAQKDAALAAQGQQMSKEHLQELHAAEARLAQREQEMQMERDRLEAKLLIMQDSNETEKIELKKQLERMQDQLLQNEADLRSHKHEVYEEIEEEMKRMADMREKKKTTDNLVMNRLTDLLGTGNGLEQTSLQKLKKETTDSRALLLGQEDAKEWMKANQIRLLTDENGNVNENEEHLNNTDALDNNDDDAEDLMSRALADLGGGDEAAMAAEEEANKRGAPRGLQKKLNGVQRLKNLVAKRMGGLNSLNGAAEHRRKKETESIIQNDADRGKILNELTQLKQKRERLLAATEAQGIETSLGQQTASKMLAVDTEILNKSMRLEQLQRSSEDDRSNPLKRFRALVAGNRARIAALAAASNMMREVLLEPERKARKKVMETRHHAEESEHHLGDLARREEILLTQAANPEILRQMTPTKKQDAELELTEVRNERAQVEREVLQMEAKAEEAIESAAALSRIRIEKDHEPLRMLRRALASRWEVEIDATRLLRRQQKEKTEKLESMRTAIAAQQSEVQKQRVELEYELTSAERERNAEKEAAILQQKRENDAHDMELQRDRRELESRMRREASESQHVEAEAVVRIKIADAMIEGVAVAERLDANDREMTVLRQEVKLLKVSTTDETEPEIQHKLETLQSSIEKLRKQRSRMNQEARTLEETAQQHVTTYDRQLESRIHSEKAKVAHGKSMMKKALVDANPKHRTYAEALVAEEGKLERLQEEMIESVRVYEEDQRKRKGLNRRIERETLDMHATTEALVSTNPSGKMIAEKIWIEEENMDRLHARLEELEDNEDTSLHSGTRKKLEERMLEENQKLKTLRSKMNQLIASNPSTRMSAAKLHQMESKLERLKGDRMTMAHKAIVHHKKKRELLKQIVGGKEHVNTMEKKLFNTNPEARAAAEELHHEEEKLLRLQAKRSNLVTQAESDREARKNLSTYEQTLRKIEATEGAIIAEEDFQVNPTHGGDDEAEVAAMHEVEMRVAKQRQLLEEARMKLVLQAEEDTRAVRKAAVKRQEANERELRANHLSELQEMRKQVETQERELEEQRILLREQKKAIAVETPRMRQKHESELLQVDTALKDREEELDEARRRLDDQAHAQLIEVERLQERAASRMRDEAKFDALTTARTIREQMLEGHAQQMDDVRAALLEKEEDLKRKNAMLKLQQARALSLPYAQRWAAQQRIRTMRKKVEKETSEIDIAKRALEAEAEKELNNIMTSAQESLRQQRREMTEAHLQDLDRANERFRDKEKELENERETLQVRIQQIDLETPRMREIKEKEIEETQNQLEKEENELAEQQKSVQDEAARRVVEVQEIERVEAEALKRTLEKRIQEELGRQHLELEEAAASQKKEMDDQTQHLLNMKKAHIEAAARGRADVDAQTVEALKNGANELHETRRSVLQEFQEKQTDLKEEQEDKIINLEEKVEDMKQDLISQLEEAQKTGKSQDIENVSNELKEVEEDYMEQLEVIQSETASNEADARVELGQRMDELTEEAEKQLAGVDQLKKEIEENMMEEQRKAKEEMQRALEDVREKHMAYVHTMEDKFAEKERTLLAAHERHTREQQRLLRKRSSGLRTSIQDALQREEDLRLELETPNGDQKFNTDRDALETQLNSTTRDRERLEKQLKSAEENSLEVLNNMESTFKKQNEKLNDKRSVLETSFRKKEIEFVERTAKLEEEVVQKAENVKHQLTHSLSQRSIQLSRESLKLEDATERLAQDMKLATQRQDLQETKMLTKHEMVEVGSQLRTGRKLPSDERVALEERRGELETTAIELEQQEQILNEQQEENVVPLSPRRSDTVDHQDTPRFQNPFVPQQQSLHLNTLTANPADFGMMNALQPLQGVGDRLQYQQPMSSQMNTLKPIHLESARLDGFDQDWVPTEGLIDERLHYQKQPLQKSTALSSQMGALQARGWEDAQMNAMQPMQGLSERLQFQQPVQENNMRNSMRRAISVERFARRPIHPQSQEEDPFAMTMGMQGDESAPPGGEEDDPFAAAMNMGGDESLPLDGSNQFNPPQQQRQLMGSINVRGSTERMDGMQPMQDISERLSPARIASQMGSLNTRDGSRRMDIRQPMQGLDERMQYQPPQQQQYQPPQPQKSSQQSQAQQSPMRSPQRNFNQNIRQEDDPFAAAMNMQGDEAAPPTQQYMQQPQQLQQPQQRYSQPSSPTRMNNTYQPSMQQQQLPHSYSTYPQQQQQNQPQFSASQGPVMTPTRKQKFLSTQQQQQQQSQQTQQYQQPPSHQQYKQSPQQQYKQQQYQEQPLSQQPLPQQQNYFQQQPFQQSPLQQYQPRQQQYQPRQQQQQQQQQQYQQYQQQPPATAANNDVQRLRAQLAAVELAKESLTSTMEQKQQEIHQAGHQAGHQADHQAGHQAGHRKAHLQNSLLGALRTQAQQSKHANEMEILAGKIRQAEGNEQMLQSRLQQAEINGQNAAQQSHVDGRRKAHLQHSLMGHLRSTAKDNIHQNQVNSLQSRVQEAARLQQELQSQLEQAQVNGQNAAQQSHVDGRRKAHLQHSLMGHLRSTAKDNIHQNQMNSLQSRVQEAAQKQQNLQAELNQQALEHAEQDTVTRSNAAKGLRHLDLKHKLINAAKHTAITSNFANKQAKLQAIIEQGERKKQELLENLEMERIKGEEAVKTAHGKGMRRADVKNRMLQALRSQAAAAKHEQGIAAMQDQIDAAEQQQKAMRVEADAALLSARQEGEQKTSSAVRAANLKNRLMGHLKKQALTKKFANEKEKLEAETEHAREEKEQVDEVLAKTRIDAANAAQEAELARKKERQARLKLSLKNHLLSQAQKDKDKLKADALKKAAISAAERAKSLNQQLADVKELAELQATAAAKKLKQQRVKGSLFAHLKRAAGDNKRKASRMSDVRKLFKKHGTGVLDKVRTDRERAVDKQKLVAMKEALVLKEQAAKEETQRIADEQMAKIKELQQQHEDVKKKMEEDAKLEAEKLQQEAKEARSTEVRGLWGKHRGTLLGKAKATREAREQKRNLEKLMADIEEEKQESAKKAKEAEEKLAEELDNQKRALEEQMEEERLQHAAEIESEALKLQEDKKNAMEALELSLAEKHKEDQEAAVLGAVKAATKKTFKGLLGKHSLNLKRVADLEKKEKNLNSARNKLEKQEEEAKQVAEKQKKTRFSSMLKRRKGDIGRMSKLTKAHQKTQATAKKAMSDLLALKKEKEGSERKNRFASMFKSAAHKTKAKNLTSETERLKKKWNERPDLRKMIESHGKLVATFRGFQLRQQWPEILEKQLTMKKNRSNSANLIQKIIRGMLGKKKMEQTRKLAWFDRPKTDTGTNTIGYAHSTQQTRAAGALLLGDLNRQHSVDSLDSARDIAERNGELSDDSIDDLDMIPDVVVLNRKSRGSRTRKERSVKRNDVGTGVGTGSGRSSSRNKRTKGKGKGSPLSALYRYTTSKPIPAEMTAYDPEFPPNRDDLINAAIETLMQ